MKKEELISVIGGVAFSATLLNAVTKAVSTIYDIARRLGSAIYRTHNGLTC